MKRAPGWRERGGYGGFALPLRPDVRIPVFKVNTENDGLLLGEYLIRQPDSMTLRTWEVAGASHVGFDPRMRRTALLVRDNLPIANVNVCAAPSLSRIPTFHVLNAALEHLVRWVRFGDPPPSAPPDHETYVSRTVAATLATVRNGFVLKGEAVETIKDAAHSAIGK